MSLPSSIWRSRRRRTGPSPPVPVIEKVPNQSARRSRAVTGATVGGERDRLARHGGVATPRSTAVVVAPLLTTSDSIPVLVAKLVSPEYDRRDGVGRGRRRTGRR